MFFRLNLTFRLLSHVAGWTDHGSLTDSHVHISNILYVRADTTDSYLQWNVTVAITEPAVGDIETFKFLIYVDGNKVKMKNLGFNKIIDLGPASPNDVYSFSAYNFRSSWKDIHVVISLNENAVDTVEWKTSSAIPAARSVRYSVEKLRGNSSIETKCSIVNIYGGKMYNKI